MKGSSQEVRWHLRSAHCTTQLYMGRPVMVKSICKFVWYNMSVNYSTIYCTACRNGFCINAIQRVHNDFVFTVWPWPFCP